MNCPVSLLRNETSRKTAYFEAFLLSGVYIPKRVSRSVEGLCGPFTGISRFLKAVFAPENGDFCHETGTGGTVQ